MKRYISAGKIQKDPRVNPDYVAETYKIPQELADLVVEARLNLNTDKGYRAFYEAEKLCKDKGYDDACLYDLAVDFAWDRRLEVAINRLARDEGRMDMVGTLYEDDDPYNV